MVCIWTRNTSKLFFYEDAKSYHMDENNLGKLDNELHVKVKKCLKQKHHVLSIFPTYDRVSAINR